MDQRHSDVELLVKEEVADLLHVSPNTVSHWVATGFGPRSARIGKRRMWRRSDCIEWLSKQFEVA